mgnify:CR=1 FL=1
MLLSFLSRHGGLRRESRQTMESSTEEKKMCGFFRPKTKKRVYQKKEVHATLRRLKISTCFANDLYGLCGAVAVTCGASSELS